MNEDEEKALKKAELYIKDQDKLKRVIAGSNRAKKSPQARRLNNKNIVNSNHVKNRFFGRLGDSSDTFKNLLCEKLNYCGDDFQLAQDVLKAFIGFLLTLSAPIYILLAELIFLLQHKMLKKYCRC